MSKFKGQYFSIVLTGRQNPQILNHDFLVKNEIIQKNREPFVKFFSENNKKQFTEFISTPILSTIKYGPISIVVEETRFQIIDFRFKVSSKNPIIDITTRYFGKHLKYTPFELGGVNFNGIIKFDNIEDENDLDKNLGITRDKLVGKINESKVRIGIAFTYPWKKGEIKIQLTKPKENTKPCSINFNYEFKYDDIENFLNNLEDVDEAFEKFTDLLSSIGVKL